MRFFFVVHDRSSIRSLSGGSVRETFVLWCPTGASVTMTTDPTRGPGSWGGGAEVWLDKGGREGADTWTIHANVRVHYPDFNRGQRSAHNYGFSQDGRVPEIYFQNPNE